DCFKPFTATVGDPVLINVGTFTVAVFGNHQYVAAHIADAHHSDHLVVSAFPVSQVNAYNTAGVASHWTHFVFMEPANLAIAGGQHNLIASVCLCSLQQHISYTYGDGIDAI